MPALSWGGGGGSSGSGTLHVLCGLYLAFSSMREAVMVCLGEGNSRSLGSARLSQFPFPLGCWGCAPRVRGVPSSHTTLPTAMAPLWLGHLHSASCCRSPLERHPSKAPHQQMFDFQSCYGKTNKQNPQTKTKQNPKQNQTIRTNQTQKPVSVLYPWSRDGGWVKWGLLDTLLGFPLQHQDMPFSRALCCVASHPRSKQAKSAQPSMCLSVVLDERKKNKCSPPCKIRPSLSIWN